MTGIPQVDPALVQQALQAFEVPGLALAVVQGDAMVFAQGYGVRRLGETAAVDEQTIFATGSISKSFTALALAMLVDEGKVAWDELVINFLPDFQLADPYVTREITVRDLLCHRSGYAPVSGGTLWYGSNYDREEVVRRLRYLKPVSSFRSRYAYQNTMFLVAGQIIPAVTGIGWDEWVQARIFTPLGMTASATSLAALDQARNVTSPHAKINGGVQPIAWRDYDNVGPAASVTSNVVDLAQYVRLYLHAGRFGEQQLVRAETMRELVSPQMVIPIEPNPPQLAALTPNFYAYGLGWFVRDYHGNVIVSHAGGVDGMTALVTMLPESQLGVIVMCNQEEALMAALTYQIIDSYVGVSPTDWIAAYQSIRVERKERREREAQAVETARVAGTLPSLALERYAGTYHDPLYGDLTIDLENDHLVLRFSQTPSFTGDLIHWHYDTFRVAWYDPMVVAGFVTFGLNAQAQVHSLQWDQPKLLDVDFAELNFRRTPVPLVAV